MAGLNTSKFYTVTNFSQFTSKKGNDCISFTIDACEHFTFKNDEDKYATLFRIVALDKFPNVENGKMVKIAGDLTFEARLLKLEGETTRIRRSIFCSDIIVKDDNSKDDDVFVVNEEFPF